MSSNKILTKKQEQQVIDAIRRAEHQTSAEVRVHIQDHCEGEPLHIADSVFHELGMDHTERQNGVLIFIAAEDQKAAIYGGKGIHKKVEEGFWHDVLELLLNHFKGGAFAQGIIEAVDKVGLKLKERYPYRQDDVNELADDISYKENQENIDK